MTETNFTYHTTDGAPLKLWDRAVPFEDAAMAQLRNVATLPFIQLHVAGMPDVHWGLGATIGSVIATKGAIIPAAVGVDIGCGMMAARIGDYFINLAKADMRKWFVNLPDENLAYLPEGTDHFDDYWAAVSWAQAYARANRELMMGAVLRAVAPFLPPFTVTGEAVNCHHNYVTREVHFGDTVLVARKGAVRAGAGELGIIPGSMGTGSFIVEGRGNPQSFDSCSHGAGRAMSRAKAKATITVDQHKAAMVGIEARLDAGVIDESPAAYKDIGAVMAAQSDLVTIRHRLRQVVNVKG